MIVMLDDRRSFIELTSVIAGVSSILMSFYACLFL